MILSNLDERELLEVLKDYQVKNYQVKEINSWLLSGYSFSEMTNISKQLREKLQENFDDIPIKILENYLSTDGTVKLLYELKSGDLIEGVIMKYEYGNTICISSQIGCKMGCKFCASGIDGLKRNLEPSELLGQVTLANRYLGGDKKDRKITNIVLMGSGEPLDNYDNVVKFLSLVNSENSLNVSHRNISLSTCGVVPKIKEFADLNLGVTLTISLHNPFNDERKEIMPITNAYSVEEVINAARYYFEKTKRRVVFEYTLIKGINDSDRYAEELAKITKGFPTHINCIIYNEIKGKDFASTTRKDGYRFVEKLQSLGASSTLRRQMGVDVEGACGMLKRRYLDDDVINGKVD